MADRAKDARELADWERNGANLIETAHETAKRLVGPLGRRWSHVQMVAARAEELRLVVHIADDPAEWNHAAEDLLVASAWLHDVGYSVEIAESGLHAADGANYLREQRFPSRLVNLVAHHSGARFEAAERGMAELLVSYPFEDDILSDALATADLTTGPSGERVTYDERIDEVLVRYPVGHPVHQFWLKARPVVGEAIARTEARLSDHPK